MQKINQKQFIQQFYGKTVSINGVTNKNNKLKNMKVIMLSGPSSSGKTTVINEVYKMLTGNYFYPSNKHKDFECTIQYNGKMIAFKSAGDESRNSIEAMRNYKTLNFDVLICAHNTNKVNPLKEILKYKHVVIQKSQPYRDNSSCLIDATKIFNQI